METPLVFQSVEEWYSGAPSESRGLDSTGPEWYEWFRSTQNELNKDVVNHFSPEEIPEIQNSGFLDDMGPSLREDSFRRFDIGQEFENIRARLEKTASRKDLQQQLKKQRKKTLKWRIASILFAALGVGLGVISIF